MTVKELIDILTECDPFADVVIDVDTNKSSWHNHDISNIKEVPLTHDKDMVVLATH